MKYYTRFRAYQLGECGASFSYSVEKHFVLIEARYNERNKPHILWELERNGNTRIDLLHITSWDNDHCKANELENILKELRPRRIEYPAYSPRTVNAKKAMELINKYRIGRKYKMTPQLVKTCDRKELRREDILYNPICKEGLKSNNLSIIKLFRWGSFSVLSLGDCESGLIRDRLIEDPILRNEVDILILAHHGADNGFTTKEFLKAIQPKVAICASDYGNQYGHPSSNIVKILNSCGIDYYSTKTGDVIVQTNDNSSYKVSNYIHNNEVRKSRKSYKNKTYIVN